MTPRPITDHSFACEWQAGIDPPPQTACVKCGYPKSLHVRSCPGSLNIKGEDFFCDLVAPHDGWAHASKDAEAIWK